MTMRAFVLDALKAKGLDVREDDLIDWGFPTRHRERGSMENSIFNGQLPLAARLRESAVVRLR